MSEKLLKDARKRAVLWFLAEIAMIALALLAAMAFIYAFGWAATPGNLR